MIREVSDALVDVISQHTGDLGDWITLTSMSDGDPELGLHHLGLCLYAVEEHPHLHNRPHLRRESGYVRPPLSLRLKYLVTYRGDHDEAQTRLARIIQIFHTTPTLGPSELGPELAEQVDTVTVRLTTTSPDERNQVWSALGRAGRLALFYDVDVAPVDLLRYDGDRQIDRHELEYTEMS